MSGQTVNPLVNEIVRAGLDPAQLQKLLATTFEKSDENPYWTFHTFELKDGPFAGGEFRQGKEGGQGLLSLMARETAPVTESDLDLSPWGEVRNISLSPRIPPEGADAYVYDVEGVKLSFQFTHASRRLRSVALEWAPTA
jgi:hypothetical protein